MVVTGELEPDRHVWLASLASDLETNQPRQLVIAAARLEAATEAAEAAARGMEKGIQQGVVEGRAQTICAIIARMLDRGGFTTEEIADIAGATSEEVRSVAASLNIALV